MEKTQSYTNGSLVAFCGKLVTKALQQLLEKTGISEIAKTIALYMSYNEGKARVFILPKRLKVLSSLKLLTTIQTLGSSLIELEGGNIRV